MEFTLPGSVEHISEEISLFEGPVTEVGKKTCDFLDYRPTSQPSRSAPLTFSVMNSNYVDLKKTRLNVKVRITKKNGHPMVVADKVALVNLSLHSIFRSVDVSLQGIDTSTAIGSNYPYKAMFDVLLDDEDLNVQTSHFCKDTRGLMDSLIMDLEGHSPDQINAGLYERHLWAKNSDIIEMEGEIQADIFKQDRLLLNGVRMNLTFYPHSDNFALMYGGEDAYYEVHIVDAKLRVCTASLKPATLDGHAKMLESKNALYPYTATAMNVYSIPAGTWTWCMDDCFQNKIPSKVVIAIVSSEAYAGSPKLNPFNFKHWDVSYLDFMVNGQSRPGQPFMPDFENRSYMSTYLAMASEFNKNRDMMINVKDFKHGYCMFVFNIDDSKALIKTGNTRIILKMAKALPETVNILVYGHFPALMEINKERQVKLHV